MNDLTTAAERYVDQGVTVVPFREDEHGLRALCKWKDTGPMLPPSVLARFKQHAGRCNVLALRTGERFDVLDIDSAKALDELGKVVGELPRSYGVASTPSGGWHYFIPAQGRGNAANMLGSDERHGGVDYRGRGGVVFAWPSRRVSKSTGEIAGYAWIRPLDLERPDVSRDEWASVLAKLDGHHAPDVSDVLVPGAPGRQAHDEAGLNRWVAVKVDRQIAKLEGATEGSRNATLNEVALNLGHYVPAHLDETIVRQLLSSTARQIGLQEDEIAATINSGLSAGMREPREPAGRCPEQRQRQAPKRLPQPPSTPAHPAPTTNEPGEGSKGAGGTVTDRLLAMARSRYTLATTEQGEAVGVPADGHVVIPLKGGAFQDELVSGYHEQYGSVPSKVAVENTVRLLTAHAHHAQTIRAHLRVARDGDVVWVDTGAVPQHAIRIDPTGWEVVPHALKQFRRTALTRELPVPTRGGDLAPLWELLNITEADRPLFLGWLVMALGVPDAPHPILTFTGEQGTGKSSATRFAARLVDPSAVETHSVPGNRNEVYDIVSGSYVAGIDNVSQLRPQVSDELCTAVTGGGLVKRALYTDDEKFIATFKPALILNGISLGDLNGDIAERMLPIELERIPDNHRRTENELAEQWRKVAPGVFGALLTMVSQMLATMPQVHLDLKPRMADFALVLAALDRINGTDSLAAYSGKAGDMAEVAIQSNDFTSHLVATLDTEFTGSASALLARITPDPAPRNWPTPRGVAAILSRAAPSLRKAGWRVERGLDRHSKVNKWTISPPQNALVAPVTELPCGVTPADPRRPPQGTPAC